MADKTFNDGCQTCHGWLSNLSNMAVKVFRLKECLFDHSKPRRKMDFLRWSTELFLKLRNDTFKDVDTIFRLKNLGDLNLIKNSINEFDQTRKKWEDFVSTLDQGSKQLINSNQAQILQTFSQGLRDLLTRLHQRVERATESGKRMSSIFSMGNMAIVILSIYDSESSFSKLILDLQEQTYHLLVSSMPVSRGTIKRRFPENINQMLVTSFNRDAYPKPMELEHLSQQTGLTEKQVSMWFTNRRSRSKRQKTHDRIVEVHGDDREEENSDANTHSPPDSPKQDLLIPPLNLDLSSEDGFFAEDRRRAEAEFYQTMFGSAMGYNWMNYVEFFRQ